MQLKKINEYIFSQKMKRLGLIFGIIVLACAFAEAKTIQRITMKNGSVYQGYISSQSGNGNFVVETDQAMVVLDNKWVSNQQSFAVSRQQLDSVWVQWGESNEGFQGESLLLTDINLNPQAFQATNLVSLPFRSVKEFKKVRLLERGTIVKFLELTPNRYELSWEDVSTVEGQRRAKMALSGINRIYQLKDGRRYEGEYAGETQHTISVLSADGVVETFLFDDILKCNYRAINLKQDILEQTPLLDVIDTKNGEIRGLVIEQDYSSDDASNDAFLMRDEYGTIQSVRISDIRTVRKVANDKEKILFDVKLKPNELSINRQLAEALSVREEGDKFIIDSLSQKITLPLNGKQSVTVSVEYLAPAAGTNVEQYQVVRIQKETVKKRGDVYYFDYRSLVNKVVRPASLETSSNGTVKAEYTIDEKGAYALYNSRTKDTYMFIVR